MQIGLRHFDSQTLDWFADAVRSGSYTRHALCRELCERTDWRNGLGEPCHSAAAKALPKLTERLGLDLPEAREFPRAAAESAPANFPDLDLRCSLEDLGRVELVPAGDADDRRLWEAMIETHHPRGWARSPGGQMRYWIRGERHGVLGGIGFGSASWKLAARDRWIGWSDDARAANIRRVICNHRFLLLPSLRAKGLASLVLRMAAGRVAGDWEERYAVRPLAAYTHVGAGRSGYSYHRAGWSGVGRTSGRRGEAGSVRAIELEDGARGALCRAERRALGSLAGDHHEEGADWAEVEYGRQSHGDGRVRARIVRMGRAWMERMGADLPVIFPEKAEQKAAFRLLSNERVTMEHILEPHYEATVDRCRREPLILAIQDTTALNYDGLKATRGLVKLGGGGKGSDGLLAHAGLAATPEGRPLGLFFMDTTFREDPEKDNARWLEGLDRAGELARACPDAKVVNLCDREGDFWQMLARAASAGSALAVRASRSTRRQVRLDSGEAECLWKHVASLPAIRDAWLEIPAAGGPRRRKRRHAHLEIRAAEVELKPPARETGAEPLAVLAVSATEIDNGEDKPLHWLLLTTERPAEGQSPADHAETVLDWYRKRWVIETWFKTLKNGTRIKDRRLSDADDLSKCLAFDAITACRVADLAVLAREHPGTPATEVLPFEYIDTLYRLLVWQGHRDIRAPPPERPPDIREVVVNIGRLVGAHPTTRQPLPGAKKVWQGWERLTWSVITREAMENTKEQ